MDGQGLFAQAFVYLAAAVVAVPIAKRLGLGAVLGYIIAGMAIGPFAFELIGEEGQDVMHFAEFGVVMMLFLIGLELQPTLLWRMKGPILGTGGLQVGLTSLIVCIIGVVVGLPWQTALAVGMTLALSSTALVLQTLDERDLMSSDAGQTAFSVLLFQDVAVIPMLALFPLLALDQVGTALAGGPELASTALPLAVDDGGTKWVDGLAGWQQTLVVLAAVAGIVLVGQYLLRPVFRVIAATRLRELFTAAALLLVLGTALLMTLVGLSPALGAFVAGVVLANSEYRHELEGDIEPFKGLLLAVFFIAVGASVDFNMIAVQPGGIAMLVGGLLLVKFTVLFGLGRIFGMGLDQNLLLAFALSQGGEFAFVLLSFATQHGVVPGDVASPLVAAVTVSMAATPLLLLLNEKLLRPLLGTQVTESRKADAMPEDRRVIIAGFGRFGSVVGRLLRANGVRPTVLEYDSDRVDLLRKLGLEVFYGDASREDLLRSAGAAKAELLIIALDSQHAALAMVETARKHFPNLRVLVRAAGRPEAYELIDHGANDVYRETLGTAVGMGVDALRALGLRGYQAHRAARIFRRHDEHSVSELGALRHDRKAYLSASRERIQSLEELLLSDLEDDDQERDAGWDTESLRQALRSGGA